MTLVDLCDCGAPASMCSGEAHTIVQTDSRTKTIIGWRDPCPAAARASPADNPARILKRVLKDMGKLDETSDLLLDRWAWHCDQEVTLEAAAAKPATPHRP